MSRTNRKLWLIGLLAIGALMVGASDASAFGWHRGWSYAYYSPVSYSACYSCYPSYYTAPCYTSCCDPCTSWTLGVRPGPVRRLAFGPYRWYRDYGCCYGGCNYSLCNTCWNPCSTCDPCGCGTSCCQPTTSGNGTAYPENEPTKAAPANGEENNMAPPLPATTAYPTYENSGLLTIYVPEQATVTINGYETETKGSRRRYVSTGLQPGLTYKYEITAQLPRDGKMAEETKVVYLTAGSTEGVAFGFNQKPISVLAAQ